MLVLWLSSGWLIKQGLVWQLSQWTPHTVTLKQVRVHWWSGHLVVEQLHIQPKQATTATQPSLEVPLLKLQWHWASLWDQKIQIDQIEFESPQLSILLDAQWQPKQFAGFLPTLFQPQKKPEKAPVSDSATDTGWEFGLGNIHVQQGLVHWQTPRGDYQLHLPVLKGQTLHTQRPQAWTQLALQAQLTASSSPKSVAATPTLAQLKLDLQGQPLHPSRQLKGRVDVTAPSLAWGRLLWPSAPLTELSGQASLKGDVELDLQALTQMAFEGQWQIDQLKVALKDTGTSAKGRMMQLDQASGQGRFHWQKKGGWDYQGQHQLQNWVWQGWPTQTGQLAQLDYQGRWQGHWQGPPLSGSDWSLQGKEQSLQLRSLTWQTPQTQGALKALDWQDAKTLQIQTEPFQVSAQPQVTLSGLEGLFRPSSNAAVIQGALQNGHWTGPIEIQVSPQTARLKGTAQGDLQASNARLKWKGQRVGIEQVAWQGQAALQTKQLTSQGQLALTQGQWTQIEPTPHPLVQLGAARSQYTVSQPLSSKRTPKRNQVPPAQWTLSQTKLEDAAIYLPKQPSETPSNNQSDEASWLGWAQLSWATLRWTDQANAPHWHLKDWQLQSPQARLTTQPAKNASSAVTLQEVETWTDWLATFSQTDATKTIDTSMEAAVTTPTQPLARPSTRVSIGPGQAQSIQVDWRHAFDAATPYQNTRLALSKVTLGAIDSAHPNQPLSLSLVGLVNDRADLALNGTVNVFHPLSHADYDFELSHFDVYPYADWLAAYLGWSVQRGRLSLTSEGQLNQGRLQTENTLLLNGWSFAESDSSELNTVKLGMKLLKDKNDRIRLDVPITGEVSAPTFSLDQVVRSALLKAIRGTTKTFLTLALQPYGAIYMAAEYAFEKATAITLEPVVFAPGQAVLTQPMQTYLVQVGRLMQKQSGVLLNVCGYTTAQDRAHLQANLQHSSSTASKKPSMAQVKEPLNEQTQQLEAALRSLGQRRQQAVEDFLHQRGAVPRSDMTLCQPRVRDLSQPGVLMGW